jgi:ADP-ribose pyrophosphatase YjhB (NUDIX family)
MGSAILSAAGRLPGRPRADGARTRRLQRIHHQLRREAGHVQDTASDDGPHGYRGRGAGESNNVWVAGTAADAVRRIGIRLSALAQDGLTYAANEYDLDRYRQLGRLAAEPLSVLSGRPTDELAVELGRDSGYATPKIDVRGAIFDDHERVLLMREKADGRWSLPGGWADPGEAPSAAVTREILEETGYHSSAVKLIACWDRELQDNPPPLPVHVYKLFFLCRRDGAVQPPAALETLDVGWFDVRALPPLSLGRVNQRQLERALAHHRDPSLPSEFD